MPVVPVTLADLRTPLSPAQNKTNLVDDLADLGFPSLAWRPGQVPDALLQVQGQMLTDEQTAQKILAEQGLNDLATGDALTLLADQMYDNQRQVGLFTVGYVTLTDAANAGPYTFSATSTSYTFGLGGLRYNGVVAAATGAVQVTIPKGGAVDVLVRSAAVGSEYAVIGDGAINTFARGAIPGVTVTNPPGWLSLYAGSQVGVGPESDVRLHDRDSSRWGTLGTGSPASAYRYWALSASQQVQKVAVYSNYDIFDPGTVNLVVASSVGPLSADVVAAVQNYVAAAQTGGRIPATARCVVSSALARTVQVTAVLYVQAAYNTPAFRATTRANLQAYFTDLGIGEDVSRERVIEVLLYQAGTAPGVIVDATVSMPAADVGDVGLFEVVVASTNLQWVSV